MKIQTQCIHCQHEEVCSIKQQADKLKNILSDGSFNLENGTSGNFNVDITCSHFLKTPDVATSINRTGSTSINRTGSFSNSITDLLQN